MAGPLDARNREAELVAQMKAYRSEPGMRALCTLLEMRLEKQNLTLRRCSIGDFPHEQARARVMDELLKEIIA